MTKPYIGFEDDLPVVSAVLKKGERSKICHLNISEDFQDFGLGEMFFSLMALESRHLAKEIYFTLPESLWFLKKEFFGSFGFLEVSKSRRQYRKSEEELCCSAPFEVVWRSVLDKLPKLVNSFCVGGYGLDSGLVMSLTPQYAEAVCEGDKKIEVRRVFSEKWKNQEVTIYASQPAGQLVGRARISNVVKDKPDKIWEQFQTEIGASKDEFDHYVGSLGEVYAIALDDVTPFRETIPLEQLSFLVGEHLVPPQSYLSVNGKPAWSSAISVASLLQGSFTRSVKP